MSGGLDSAVMAAGFKDAGADVFPLHITYGQRAAARELAAFRSQASQIGTEPPMVMDLSGYASVSRSALLDADLPIVGAAFLPGRNLAFLLFGAVYATTVGATKVGIGLLHPQAAIFDDQRDEFLAHTETLLRLSVMDEVQVLTPLRGFTKSEVVGLASELGIKNTYSCHAGGETACGVCIACREFEGIEHHNR